MLGSGTIDRLGSNMPGKSAPSATPTRACREMDHGSLQQLCDGKRAGKRVKGCRREERCRGLRVPNHASGACRSSRSSTYWAGKPRRTKRGSPAPQMRKSFILLTVALAVVRARVPRAGLFGRLCSVELVSSPGQAQRTSCNPVTLWFDTGRGWENLKIEVKWGAGGGFSSQPPGRREVAGSSRETVRGRTGGRVTSGSPQRLTWASSGEACCEKSLSK